MADNERNKPIQDPENLEKEIQDTQPVEENGVLPEELEEVPVEPLDEPVEEPSSEEPTDAEPAEEPSAEELTDAEPAEEPAEGMPEDENPEPVSEDETPADAAEADAGDEAEEDHGEVNDEPIERLVTRPVKDINAVVVDEDVVITAKAFDGELGEEPAKESSEGASKPDGKQAGYDKFEIGISDDGELYLVSSDESEEESDESQDKESDGESAEGESGDEYDPDADVDPEDLVIYEEVLEPIRLEGERLINDEICIGSYLKHSNDAVKNLESALKTAQKALDTNRDDKEAPVILVGIIKICGRILEIKCNVLENIARIKAHNYIREAKVSLHNEVERYNEYVITYASITGEQLTRLSTFLPENIASGKSLAVIPELSYVEYYEQILPDEKMSREALADTMLINPSVTADDLLSEIKPPSGRASSFFYARKIKKAMKKLVKERARINKLITENKASRRRYQSELESLEKRTPLHQRTSDEYKSKVLEIKIKYGKQLSGIKTVKTAHAFARAKLNLTVNRMAIEREMLVLSYEYLRAIVRAGSYSQRKAAERVFAKSITSYNQAAEITSKATGTKFDTLPTALIELTCKNQDISFPVVAYKRKLVEKVGDASRLISMALSEDILPDEQTYSENSEKVLEKHNKIKTSSLSEESAMIDRASAIAKVIIESLRESAEMVVSANDYDQFEIKSRRALKYFKRSLKGTQRSMSRAFDENGVVIALIENLRVIANIIEVRRLIMAVALKLNRRDAARNQGRALYKCIELYNGRAIDYISIVGEQFSRITTATSKELMESADRIKVPVITYKDNYIEVFPKDPLKDSSIYEKPRRLRGGDYTPLMMHHYRLTQNRAVETTVVNAPFVFDVNIDDSAAVSWWHPIGFWQHLFVWWQPIAAWWKRIWVNAEIWVIEESLLFSKGGVSRRQSKNDKKKARYERKLKKLNAERDAKILALETVIHESDRRGESYQKQIYKINSKFGRKVYRLNIRWMRDCSARNAARMLLERLVLERERLAGINKVLLKYRNYGRVTLLPNVLVRYKKKFIEAITDHNKTAEKLSEMIGVKFAQVSTSVADEIIRYGKMIKFPEIICCREVIENVDGKERTVGDRWHGYGLYTGTSGSPEANAKAPVMSVGAMGYATDMGVPFLKADFEGMTLMGMTPGGVPLIGFSQTGEASIPFTGTPMMLSGADNSVVLDAGQYGQDSLILGAANVADPHSGVHRRGVDAGHMEGSEDDEKDINSGCTVETPLDLEAKLIEERFTRALRARSMTSVDGVLNWWKQLFSEINLWLMRHLVVRRRGFFRSLLPRDDVFTENVNGRIEREDARILRYLSKVSGVIEIETKRLYSASKTGIRRSQRVLSAWLHEDIQLYNKIVNEFNARHERHMHIELLSLNMPDSIRFRTDDRPPAPPLFSLRNRAKINESRPAIRVDQLYRELYLYSRRAAFKHAGIFRLIWSALVTVPLIIFFNWIGCRSVVRFLMTGIIANRSKRTYAARWENESRHYYIRYEKSRNMKRYNRRTLRAIGVANDPIKYQTKTHKGLRKYLSRNFRIDYNMRIRQLIYRALSVEVATYWIVTLALAAVVTIAALFLESSTALQLMMIIALGWAALPIVFFLLRRVYDLVLFIVNILCLITRNIALIRHGARDVERNRYGIVLDCFISEQYRVLLACERLRRRPRSSFAKKALIAAVNDHNKRLSTFSDTLRLPLKPIEITSLMEKLRKAPDSRLNAIRREVRGQNRRASADEINRLVDERLERLIPTLDEIQSFVYVRELVERVDAHQVGKTLKSKELDELVAEINQIINSINLNGNENQIEVQLLQDAMKRFIDFVQTDVKPTQNERYELKRDLIQGISRFDISEHNKETFIRDVIKVVDQLGGRDSRKIIAILARDNMID